MQRLIEGLAGSGAHFFDALQAFLALGWKAEEYDELYLWDDPHMSRRGNEVLAALVAEYIEQNIWGAAGRSAAQSPAGGES